MRILLVEDDLMNRKVIRALLEGMEVDLREAEDGEQGLAAFEGEDFDVVLMDLRMPKVDGFDAIRAIRARTDYKRDVPLVVITADTAVNISGLCKQIGADGVLFKPVNPIALYNAVGDAVASRDSRASRSA